MGLVQLFRDSPCPDVLARRLLELALEDFCETGFHYLLYLVMSREKARRVGTTQEVEALNDQINVYAIDEQFPQQWHLEYRTFKDGGQNAVPSQPWTRGGLRGFGDHQHGFVGGKVFRKRSKGG